MKNKEVKKKKMKRKLGLAFVLAVTVVMLLSSTAVADDYEGWDEEIRPALIDGYGDEFVKPIPGLDSGEFSAATEWEAVKEAATWLSGNMVYEADIGEVWTSSDWQYAENPRKGDCEDYAILLTALLRFHTQEGIPANRVWVSGNLVTVPGAGVVAAHAWVGYKLERGGMAYIEPRTGKLYRGRPKGMLTFNDEWVKGGGFWLAGPRK
jgi:transglutaminase-like putative cysteine protease